MIDYLLISSVDYSAIVTSINKVGFIIDLKCCCSESIYNMKFNWMASIQSNFLVVPFEFDSINPLDSTKTSSISVNYDSIYFSTVPSAQLYVKDF